MVLDESERADQTALTRGERQRLLSNARHRQEIQKQVQDSTDSAGRARHGDGPESVKPPNLSRPRGRHRARRGRGRRKFHCDLSLTRAEDWQKPCAIGLSKYWRDKVRIEQRQLADHAPDCPPLPRSAVDHREVDLIAPAIVELGVRGLRCAARDGPFERAAGLEIGGDAVARKQMAAGA